MRLSNGAGRSPQTQETERPDLQAVLEHYGFFVPHSGVYECAVHDETVPSMSVNLEQGLWNCFACGQAGDSWTIIEIKEQTDFNGAREKAAAVGFEGSAADRRSPDVSPVTGRRRPNPSGGKGSRRRREWVRPW